MSYDTNLGLQTRDPASQKTVIRQRTDVLTRLGLAGLEHDAQFDAFATDTSVAFVREFGEVADGLYAMVNLISVQQVFVGLHIPPGKRPVGRTMSRDDGYCPVVADRGLPLVLSYVLAAPRFASNRVVDAISIRTYAGTPLLDPGSGLVFGTLCVIGNHRMPEETEDASLALIKERGAQLMGLIQERVALPQPSPPSDEPGGAPPPGSKTDPAPA